MKPTSPRIYLDHAATSWPKSEAVLTAMVEFSRHCGAAAGRGGYRSAAAADQIVAGCRRALAHLIGAESAETISLHSNGTTALNAAIHGVLRSGDHVVTTAAEHNSVLRPLQHLASLGKISLTVASVDPSGAVNIDELLAAVGPATRLVTLTHASNVTGHVQPIDTVGEALASHSALYLCDAAQTFGALPIDVTAARIDLLAAPGHKASGGPLGTGFLYASPRASEQLQPLVQGGTGSHSESLMMPAAYPHKLEAGNLNVPALAGWQAALAELAGEGLPRRAGQLTELNRMLYRQLDAVPGLRVHGHSEHLPIASVTFAEVAPTDLSAILDSEFGIETRGGLHCAALIHRYLGSDPGGTLRISGGHDTTAAELAAAAAALGRIAASLG